jgi:hypothetical protein
MPIIGTPVFVAPPVSSVSLSPLIQLAPAITEIYKRRVPSKMRGMVTRQSQQIEIALNLLDGAGNPIDLTMYGFPGSGFDPDYTIMAKVAEATGVSPVAGSVSGTVLDSLTGSVKFTPPGDILVQPGIYLCEVGALATGGLITSSTFYLMVERGLFTVSDVTTCPSYLPSLDELRLALRDSPTGNRLTDEYEFDIAEICQALTMAVIYWNAAPPIIDEFFSTITFPYRWNWVDGACACLLDLASHHYRRVHLAYQGGGIAVDDLNKAKEYEEAAAGRRQSWEQWVRMNKVSRNMAVCFSTFGSPYGDGYGYW